MECSLALSMMSCRLLVCLVFGLAFQIATVESFTTWTVRIFRGGGLVNNDDTGQGNIMKELARAELCQAQNSLS